MVSVPGFLLRRLYVKGSLQNSPDGFRFELKNSLGSGYAHKLSPLTVDGEEISLNKSYFILENHRTSFGEVSRENTFALAMNKTITVEIEGSSLEPGPRKIGMGFEVPGLGTLKFDFTDVVADQA